MINKKGSLTAIRFYMIFFIVMLTYAYILTFGIFKDNLERINQLDFENTLSLIIFVVHFTLLQLIILYIMTHLSRLDGFWYLSSEESPFVSVPSFLRNNISYLNLIILLLALALINFSIGEIIINLKIYYLFIISSIIFVFFYFRVSIKDINNYYAWMTGLFTLLPLTFCSLSESKKSIDFSYHYNFITVLLLVCSIYLFIILKVNQTKIFSASVIPFSFGLFLILDSIPSSGKAYISLIFGFLFLAVFFISPLIDIFRKQSKIRLLLKKIIYSEYLLADQSKKNAENLSIIKYFILDNEKSSLYKKISEKFDSVFLKPHDNKKSAMESSFVDIKLHEDFRLFMKNAKKQITDPIEVKELQSLEKSYISNRKSFTETLMESRTENIKMRNQNNLIVGSLIYLVATIVTWLVIKDYLQLFILYLLMWMIFIRMVLRTVEIGKAFSKDLSENGYNKSFLAGTDRIILALKSVIELCFLSSAIYLLYQPLSASDQELKILFWRTFEYSLSVALFNVSFPEALLPASTKGFLWLLTHLTQVIASLLLITIGINGYMNRDKNLVYFEFIFSEDNTFKILKKIKNHPHKTKTVLRHKFYGHKRKNKSSNLNNFKSEDIIAVLNKMYQNNKITDKDYDHLIRLLEGQKYYFLPPK